MQWWSVAGECNFSSAVNAIFLLLYFSGTYNLLQEMKFYPARHFPCQFPFMQLQQATRKFFGFFLLLLFASCGQAQQKGPAAGSTIGVEQRYNLSAPEIINLPESIPEISGISYNKADHSVFAVDDEQGSLFRINLQKNTVVEQFPVSGKKDYEDLVLTNKSVYLLSSEGSIVFFPFAFPVSGVQQADQGLKGKNEFEILLKDPAAERLLMVCKSCREDKKGEVSVYDFNLASNSFAKKPVAVIRVKEIEAIVNEKIGDFRPSGAAVHPRTGEFYLVSSVNKLLVVTAENFGVKEVYKLDPSLFKQPEGLSFTPAGDLLISNESAGKGSANILLFRQNR